MLVKEKVKRWRHRFEEVGHYLRHLLVQLCSGKLFMWCLGEKSDTEEI